jgi:hypothetical protein
MAYVFVISALENQSKRENLLYSFSFKYSEKFQASRDPNYVKEHSNLSFIFYVFYIFSATKRAQMFNYPQETNKSPLIPLHPLKPYLNQGLEALLETLFLFFSLCQRSREAPQPCKLFVQVFPLNHLRVLRIAFLRLRMESTVSFHQELERKRWC